MANEYAVNRADLVAVADAIRTKGGTSDALTFPDGFVEAVVAIQAGGGGGDSVLPSILNKSVVEFRDDNITAMYTSRLFENCTSLTTVIMPNLESIHANNQKSSVYTFNGCIKLKTVDFSSLKQLSMAFFTSCSALEKIVLPSLHTFSNNNNFQGCTSLTCVDLARKSIKEGNKNFSQKQFLNCTNLKTLILRAEDSIWILGNLNNFDNTPFASGGTGGTVYVPSALIDQYKTATNWVTLYDAGSLNFVAIEGSGYE